MFPTSWIDEGFMIMVSKTLAAGHGYALPILGRFWHYPYILAVGPTVIVPAAFSIKLFGLSVAAARLPMTLYILGSCVTMYAFTRRLADTSAARWTALLLVTLSAFINTGKPVLGEIPGFFFLLLGLAALSRAEKHFPSHCVAGACFGLAVMTKLTFAFIYPILGILCCVAFLKKQWKTSMMLAGILVIAIVVYFPWRMLEISGGDSNILEETLLFVTSGIQNDTVLLNVFRRNPALLLRIPYLAFGIFLLLGGVGVWHMRKRMPWFQWGVITLLIASFTFHSFNLYGWYRHLLPAHLLLLIFVPIGAARLAGRKLSALLMTLIALLQGVWQFQHRGSGIGTELAKTVRIVREDYAETDLLIEQAEVFAQLPENPHWLFINRQGFSATWPEKFSVPDERQRCFLRLRKLNDQEAADWGDKVVPVGNSFIIPAPPDCANKK